MINLEYIAFYLGGAFVTGIFIVIGLTWKSYDIEDVDPGKLLAMMIVWPFTVILLIIMVSIEIILDFRKKS